MKTRMSAHAATPFKILAKLFDGDPTFFLAMGPKGYSFFLASEIIQVGHCPPHPALLPPSEDRQA